MIISQTRGSDLEISDRHWSIAENLFVKWGYDVSKPIITSKDVSGELSAWGIPWKWL